MRGTNGLLLLSDLVFPASSGSSDMSSPVWLLAPAPSSLPQGLSLTRKPQARGFSGVSSCGSQRRPSRMGTRETRDSPHPPAPSSLAVQLGGNGQGSSAVPCCPLRSPLCCPQASRLLGMMSS